MRYFNCMHELFIKEIIIDWNKIEHNSYLRKIKSLTSLNTMKFENNITLLAGENGSGKSTLLEAIAICKGFNPEGGTKNYSFSTYDSHSSLCDAMTISKGYRKEKTGYFFRAESFYNVATMEERYADPAHESMKYHYQSHGESFLSLFQNYLDKDGLYILDEPEAALSPQRQLTLLMEICNYARKGAQFIIATHSPILLGMPDSQILLFNDAGIRKCAYEETDSYKITKMFVNDRERLLDKLLD